MAQPTLRPASQTSTAVLPSASVPSDVENNSALPFQIYSDSSTPSSLFSEYFCSGAAEQVVESLNLFQLLEWLDIWKFANYEHPYRKYIGKCPTPAVNIAHILLENPPITGMVESLNLFQLLEW